MDATTKDDAMTNDGPVEQATTDDLLRLDAEAVADDDLDESYDAEATAEATRRRMRRVASQVYSVRIPVDRLEDLRQLAVARNEAPTALMRRWVLERLDAETLGTDPAAGSGALPEATVESLQRAIATLTAAVETFTQAAQGRDDAARVPAVNH